MQGGSEEESAAAEAAAVVVEGGGGDGGDGFPCSPMNPQWHSPRMHGQPAPSQLFPDKREGGREGERNKCDRVAQGIP